MVESITGVPSEGLATASAVCDRRFGEIHTTMRNSVFCAVAAGLLASLACSSSPSKGSSSGSAGATNGAGSNGATGGSAGSSGGTAGSNGGGGALSTACDEVGTSVCDYVSRCQLSVPEANCAPMITASCISESQNAVAAGRQQVRPSSQFDAVCGSAAVAQLPCNGVGYLTILFGCGLGVTEGVVPAGGVCHVDQDCESETDGGSLYCDSPANTCGGVCATDGFSNEACLGQMTGTECDQGYCLIPTDGGDRACTPFLAEGAACPSGQGCDPSQDYCNFFSSMEVCSALVGPGGACSGYGCETGYHCVNPDAGFTDQTCVAELADGQPCNPQQFGECLDSSTCVQAGFCAPYNGVTGGPCDTTSTSCEQSGVCVGEGSGPGTCTLVDAGPLQGLGSPCTGAMDDEASCATREGGFTISGDYRCVAGVCSALPGIGQACSLLGHCLAGALCVQGTCAATPTLGQACLTSFGSAACATGYCDPASNTCAAFLAVGASCSPALFQCSTSIAVTSLADGGQINTDGECDSADGGATFCLAPCD